MRNPWAMIDRAEHAGHDERMMTPNRNPEPRSRGIIPFPNACAPFSAHPVVLDREEEILLEAARWWLIKSRLTPRAVIDEACFLLGHGIPCEVSAYGTAFFRLLDLHASRDLKVFMSGVMPITDDERWLLQLLKAAMDEDDETVAILIGWRVVPQARRRAIFLASQLGQLLRDESLENLADITT